MDPLSIQVQLSRKDFSDGIALIKKEVQDLQGDVNRIVASMRAAATSSGSSRSSGSSGRSSSRNSVQDELTKLNASNEALKEHNRLESGYRTSIEASNVARKRATAEIKGGTQAQVEQTTQLLRSIDALKNGAREFDNVRKRLSEHQKELIRGRRELARLQDQESNKLTGISLGGFNIDRGQVQEARQLLKKLNAEQVATDKTHGKILTDQAKENSLQRLAVTREFLEQNKRGARKFHTDAVTEERAYYRESRELKNEFISDIREADREEALLQKAREAERKKNLQEEIADARKLKREIEREERRNRDAFGTDLTQAGRQKHSIILANQKEGLDQQKRDANQAVQIEKTKQNVIVQQAKTGATEYLRVQSAIAGFEKKFFENQNKATIDNLKQRDAAVKRFLASSGGSGGGRGPGNNPPDDGGNFFGRVSSFITRFAAFTLAAGILTRGFFAIEGLLQKIVARGIEFNKSLENTKFSIAAILTSSRELVSSTGETASVAASYPVFLEKAKQFQKELLLLNITTLGTGEELQGVFQRVLAFSQDQVATDKERLLLTTNILNAGKLLGLVGEQINTEARQILTLEQNRGQTILQSVGVTVQQLRAYKEQGILVQKLNELLSAYSVISKDVGLTFEGLVSTVQTFFDLLAGQAFEPTFRGLKDVLKGAAGELRNISESGSVLTAVGLSSEDLQELGRNLAQVTTQAARFMADLTNATLRFASQNEGAFRAMAFLVEGVAGAFGGLLEIINKSITGVGQLVDALSYLKPPTFLSDSNFGRRAGAFIKGAVATGVVTGGNPILSFLGGVANAQRESQTIVKEQENAAKATKRIADAVSEVQFAFAKLKLFNPQTKEDFNTFVKITTDISKRIDGIKNEDVPLLPEIARKEELKKLNDLQSAVINLASAFEQTKDSLHNFLSEQDIKNIDKLTEFTQETTQHFKDAQSNADLAADALGQLSPEEATLGVAAEEKKRNLAKERLEIEERIQRVFSDPKFIDRLESKDKFNEYIDHYLTTPKTALNRRPALLAPDEELKNFLSSTIELAETTDDYQNRIKKTIAETVRLEQQQERSVGAIDEGVRAYEDLTQEQIKLTETTDELTVSYNDFLAKLSNTPSLDFLADETARAAEGQRRLNALVNRFPGLNQTQLGVQVANAIATEEQAKYRKDIFERLNAFTEAEERRVQVAIGTSESITKIRQSELEAQKTLLEEQKSTIEDQLSEAENNSGIANRENNSLQDRIRLIQQVAEKEVELIRIGIEEKKSEIDGLNEINRRLRERIENIEKGKQAALNALGPKATDLEKLAITEGPQTRTQDELGRQIKENTADAKALQAQMDASGNAISRVIRNTNNEIRELSNTIVDLNNPIANLAGNLFDAFQKGGKGLKNVFKTLQKDIQQSFSDAFRESIKKKLQFDLEFKGNIFDLGSYFKDTFSNAVSFVGKLFGNAGGSGQGGFFSNLGSFFGGSSGSTSGSGGFSLSDVFSMFGGGSSGPGNTSNAGGGGLFSGGSSNLGSSFGFGSGGDQSSWWTKIFGGTNFGGSSGTPTGGWQQAPGGTFGGISPTGSSAVTNGGQGFGSGTGSSVGGYAALIPQAINAGQNFSKGRYGAGAGAVAGGVIGGFFGGPMGAQIGAQIGEMIGSIFDSIFLKIGRIEKEKKKLIKFFEEALDVNFDVLKEKKVAKGFEEFKGPTSAAAIALGSQYASEQKNATQGTVVRFAGQGLGNFRKEGYDVEEAQEAILDLAEAMDFDIKQGIKSLKANMSDGVLSLKTFKEELKEAKKNLREYGDTSNLTAKELSDLATANGNTGSRLVTINEVIAGTIDIYAEFDEFIDGATIANEYLAKSFTETAKATDFFNTDIENLAEQIDNGTLSLEEATIELNRFRKEAGLSALDLKDFKISAKDIQEQVDTIKEAVQTLRDALKTGLVSSTTVIEFKKEDIEKNFKKAVYSSMVDAVAEGMVDGIIKGTLAAGPISEALSEITDLTSKFVAGDLTEGEFFTQLEGAFTKVGPVVDRLAIALGVSSEHLRTMLDNAGVLPFLLDEAKEEVSELGKALHDAAKGALLDGLKAEKFDAKAVEKNFRRAIYGTLVDIIVDGFIDGFIKATLATGPLEAAMKNIKGLIDKFVAGDINFDQFGQFLQGELEGITPLIERIAVALGLTTESLRNILDAAGILPDILDEAGSNAEDLAKELRQAAKDLLLDSSLSPLKPKQRVAEAQSQFEELRRKALAGDEEAARKLPEAARQFLEEARKVFASSSQYEQIFDYVRGTLLDVADKFGPLEDTAEKQLRTLEDVRAYLKTIDINLAKLSGGDPAKVADPTRTDDSTKPGESTDSNTTGRRGTKAEDTDAFKGDRLKNEVDHGSNHSIDSLLEDIRDALEKLGLKENTPVGRGGIRAEDTDAFKGDRLKSATDSGSETEVDRLLKSINDILSRFGLDETETTSGRKGDRAEDTDAFKGDRLRHATNPPGRNTDPAENTDAFRGDRLRYATDPDQKEATETTNTLLVDAKNVLQQTLDELGLATSDEERRAAEDKVVEAAQLLSLQTTQELLTSIDKTLKKISGDTEDRREPEPPGVADQGRRTPGPRIGPNPGSNFGFTGPVDTWEINPHAPIAGPRNTTTDISILLTDIDDSIQKLSTAVQNTDANGILNTINQALNREYDWIVFATTHTYNRLVNIMNLLSRIAGLPSNAPPFEAPTSLAEGGIVTGYGIPATLHGPEAVIPLNQENIQRYLNPAPESATPIPYRGNRTTELSSPELIEEIRGLRQEIRNSHQDSDDRPINVYGELVIGQERMGKFIQTRVQGDLRNKQIIVPQGAISKY